MPVHKFGKSPRRSKTSSLNQRQIIVPQPATIHWKPRMDVIYPPQKTSPVTWKVYSQVKLTIQPKEIKIIQLGVGVTMSKGLLLTSLVQEIKYKCCSLQNETVIESVDDIIITIQNNSNSPVSIEEGIPLCFIHYIL